MDHPCIVQQQRCQRFAHHKAHALRAMGIKHPRFAALHAMALHQHHHDKIYTVAVRAFRCGAAYAARGVDPELVRLYKPFIDGLDLRKKPAKACNQFRPCWGLGNRRLNGFKPALKPAMQGVVIRRLPVRPMRCLRQDLGGHVLHKAGVAALPVAATIFQVRVRRQLVPGFSQFVPGLRPIWGKF